MEGASTMELSLAALFKRYQDEQQAWLDLEGIVWPDGPICPHCGTIGHAYFLNPRAGTRSTRTGKQSFRRVWKCGSCRKQFSVIKGTVMEGSHIPLSKWLIAIHLFCANKNGVAAYELHRELEITYEAAWFMVHRIRYAVAAGTTKRPLSGTVEADETYVGGKVEGKGRGPHRENKTPVVTLVERNGDARSQVMVSVNSSNLRDYLWGNIDADAHLMTDSSNSYVEPGLAFASHETVDHSAEEWVRGNVHTNTAEGYFSQFKRSLDGTFHHVSPQHLHRYVSEFDFRYNTRKEKDAERMVRAIRRGRGKRLMYEQTTKKAPPKVE